MGARLAAMVAVLSWSAARRPETAEAAAAAEAGTALSAAAASAASNDCCF